MVGYWEEEEDQKGITHLWVLELSREKGIVNIEQ